MADNQIYISSGIISNDTGEAENSNEFFIAAGIVPDDADGGPSEMVIPIVYHHRRRR